MPTLDQFREHLVSHLGFKEHQINDGDGTGVLTTVEGLAERASFVAAATAGNCYAAFKHEGSATLSTAEASRYKALSILLPNGPAAYCVVEVGGHLRLYYVEKGNEIHDPMAKWDNVRDAEDMVRELKPEVVKSLEQWARTTLRTENSLPRFVQLMKGCWQDIWDIENKRNDWIFDEFTRFLFIKLNEDGKPNGAFTPAKLKSYCDQNKHMGDKAAQNFINNLFDDLKGKHPEVFTDENEKVQSKAETVRKVIERLGEINLKDTQGDVLGRAFEIMLSDTFKGRDLGQFFTPREIVAFMLDLARDEADAPALDLDKGERFLDACAGSGGFLIAAYEDAYKHALSDGAKAGQRQKLLKRLGQETFYACEIEEKAARLGKLNMIIHAVDDQNAQWIHQNYLYNEEYGGLNPDIEYAVDFGEGPKKRRIGPDSVDLVLTNPPFGKAVKSNAILQHYEMGTQLKEYKTRPSRRISRPSQSSEVLFVEHYIRALKPGGRMLTILPDGLLSTRSGGPVRKFIREHTVVEGVISLPIETFMATSAQIPTAILMLRKRGPGTEQHDVFMAKAKNVGRKANGEACPGSELEEILGRFHQWRSRGHSLSKQDRLGFSVQLSANEPQERLDVDAYWRGDDFHVLSAESLKVINSLAGDYVAALDEIDRLADGIRVMRNEVAALSRDVSTAGQAALRELGELVDPVSRPVAVRAEEEYRLIGVRWYGEGAYVKEEKQGRHIKAKTLYRALSHDLIVSRLFAWKGSIAVVDESCDHGVASGEFPMYVAKADVDVKYLGVILQSPSVWADISKLCTGTSKQSRNRIHEEDLMALKIPVIHSEAGRIKYVEYVERLRMLTEQSRRLADLANVVGFMQRTQAFNEMNARAIVAHEAKA